MLKLLIENISDKKGEIMAEWKNYTLEEVCERIYSGGTPSTKHEEYWNGDIKWLSSGETSQRFVYDTERKITQEGVENSSTKLATKGCTVIATAGQGYTRGQASFLMTDTYMNQSVIACKANENVILPLYLYYNLDSRYEEFRLLSDGTSTRGGLSGWILKRMEIKLPPKSSQKKIIGILYSIDRKIEENNAINNNLEEQLSALFVNMFGHSIDSLDNSDIKLGDLIESVDNRGKTPPLSDKPTDYPIIDVRALSGNSRIIDYTNCTKYVSKETYNNWFRSGHPKKYDILISTVGSLAEMKIFLGTIGCIAQNVVGFRTKGISPLYLYQYLNYIKNNLIAYNIGSVQPSIKVTHIIKHSIYVASKEDIEIFDSIARNITKKIFANCQENEALKQTRDTLLPRLMSGELDVSDIDL